MRVLTVIPTYNEKENLPVVVERLRKAAPEVDILVVDDNSPDGTGQIADDMAAKDPQIHVLHRTVKDGLGGAYLAGFDWGLAEGYEILIEMDADCSHQPEQLPSLVRAVEAGADLAIGSRYVPGGKTKNWPIHRQILSRGANLYTRTILGTKVKDITAGFRAYRLCRSLPRPTVATVHNELYDDFATAYGRLPALWMTRSEVRALRRFDLVVACSRSGARVLAEKYALACECIRNGVDQDLYAPASEDRRARLRAELGRRGREQAEERHSWAGAVDCILELARRSGG